MTKPPKKIKIWSFETSGNLSACLDFAEGYNSVLTDQNINILNIIDYKTLHQNAQFGILAQYEGDIIGGLLLFHPSEKQLVFPFQETTAKASSNSPFKMETNPEIAEVYALWHSTKAAGWGLSYILLKAGLALSLKLGFQKTLYLTADYNIRLVEKLGLEALKIKGYDAFFRFDTNKFQTRAYLYLLDQENIYFAKKEKLAIQEIASIQSLIKTESILGTLLEIEYQLALG